MPLLVSNYHYVRIVVSNNLLNGIVDLFSVVKCFSLWDVICFCFSDFDVILHRIFKCVGLSFDISFNFRLRNCITFIHEESNSYSFGVCELVLNSQCVSDIIWYCVRHPQSFGFFNLLCVFIHIDNEYW